MVTFMGTNAPIMAQELIVLKLIKEGKATNVADIGRNTTLFEANVRYCVKKLVSKKIITREGKGRTQKLFLTTDGEEYAKQLEDALDYTKLFAKVDTA